MGSITRLWMGSPAFNFVRWIIATRTFVPLATASDLPLESVPQQVAAIDTSSKPIAVLRVRRILSFHIQSESIQIHLLWLSQEIGP